LANDFEQASITRNENPVPRVPAAADPRGPNLQSISGREREALDDFFRALPDLNIGQDLAPRSPQVLKRHDSLHPTIGSDLAVAEASSECAPNFNGCCPPDSDSVIPGKRAGVRCRWFLHA